MIPLITSIPPRMSRIDANGVEIGPEYQSRCIDSWRTAGFDPVSINSSREPKPDGVRVIEVDRDAACLTGRPHVYFADMLTAGIASGTVFAITNADVTMAPHLGASVAAMRPGEMIFSRRVDIDHMGETTGEPWPVGFDFFAMHAENASWMPNLGMVFGAPWWDHYLPIMMHALKVRVRQIEPAVYHLKHDDRWDWQTWTVLGHRLFSGIRTERGNLDYLQRMRRAELRRTGRVLSDIKYSVWKRLAANVNDEPKRILQRFSQLNVAFVDEIMPRTQR